MNVHEMLKCDRVAVRPYIARVDSCHPPSSADSRTPALSLPHMLTLADSAHWSRKATWDETTTKNGLDSSHDYPMHAAHDHHRHSAFFSDGGEQSVRQLPPLVIRPCDRLC